MRTSKQIPEPEHWEKPIPAMILTRVSSQFEKKKKEWTEYLKPDMHEDLCCEFVNGEGLGGLVDYVTLRCCSIGGLPYT